MHSAVKSESSIVSADVAQLVEQCFRKAKVSGSTPLIGSSGYSLVVERDLPKVEMRVRFPLPAPKQMAHLRVSHLFW